MVTELLEYKGCVRQSLCDYQIQKFYFSINQINVPPNPTLNVRACMGHILCQCTIRLIMKIVKKGTKYECVK